MASLLANEDVTAEGYLEGAAIKPLFLCGDALDVLQTLPESSVDCVMTSPPYWSQRAYSGGGIGLEDDYEDYITNLVTICGELQRILKPTGSFWLNIGDAYLKKNLLGIPWRVALRLTDEQGWLLRNSVIWHKVKGGPDNSKDKLRNVHENLFHFVKSPDYFYDVDAIRSKPGQTKVINGEIVSATGVSGVRYRRQVELSTVLSDVEKQNALAALNELLAEVHAGRLSDFRMIIRGQQRTTRCRFATSLRPSARLGRQGILLLEVSPQRQQAERCLGDPSRRHAKARGTLRTVPRRPVQDADPRDLPGRGRRARSVLRHRNDEPCGVSIRPQVDRDRHVRRVP